MTTIKFDDFLQDELKQEDFKAGYLAEKSILESAIAVFNARQNAGLTQRELADLSHWLISAFRCHIKKLYE